MRVHIVTEGNRIKMRISEKIIKYNQSPIEYSLSYSQRDDVDINFYICYNVFSNFNKKSKVKDIGYVTHIHNNSILEHEKDLGKPFSLFNQLDAYLHMNSHTKQFFPENKYHAVIYGGCELEKFRPTINLGIMQNGEVIGKGTQFIMNLVDKFDFSNFNFIFCGVGWEQVINKLSQTRIRYKYLKELDYNHFSEVYEKIDYLFIPSLWEGGPMAVVEAMACNLPIISADTGWVRELAPNSLLFKPGNIEEAKAVFNNIQMQHLIRYPNIEDLSYKSFCARLHTHFSNILEGVINV